MKTLKLSAEILFTLLLLFSIPATYAQDKQQRDVSGFNGIEARGAFKLIVVKSGDYGMKIESDPALFDKVSSKVDKNTLYIETQGVKNFEKITVTVSLPELKLLNTANSVSAEGASVFKSQLIVFYASGASDIDMEIVADEVGVTVSGAAEVKLKGSAAYGNIKVSGAGTLEASELIINKADCYITGAGHASLNVTDELTGSVSNSASYSNAGAPRLLKLTQNKSYDSRPSYQDYYVNDYRDSVKVKIGRMEINYYEDNDSMRLRVGNRELKIDDNGNLTFHRCKKPRFNGHWAGFEMGLNGYVNSDFNMKYLREDEFMDLNMAKSISVYLNFFEQNVSLSQNQKWGLVTGFGTYWNNYRFNMDTRLNSDSAYLIGYIYKGVSIRKSKLVTWYLSIPLLFEFQTNAKMKKNSFHISVGMISSLRLTSHTKTYYDEFNKEFEVTRYDPETNSYETVFTATSPGQSKVKDFDDYYLQPFKFDATVRIGWGFVNLFATYSLNKMFRKDKGPELYPWSAGITLVNL